MTADRDDLRQNLVVLWLMRAGTFLLMLGSISLFVFIPIYFVLPASSALSNVPTLVMLVVGAWVSALFLGLSVAATWGGLTLWERYSATFATSAEHKRYRQMSGGEPSLPEDSWSDSEPS